MSKSVRGSLLVLSGAMLWGTTGTSQALAPAGAHSLSIGAARIALGGLVLLVFALARRDIGKRRSWPLAATVVAMAAMAAYQPLFFSGVRRAGVAVGTLVGIGSSPLIASVLAFIVNGERPEKRWYAATLLSVLGCVFLLSGRDGGTDAAGVLLAVGAGAAYAVYTLCSKRLLESHSPVAVPAVVFTGSALLLAPLLFLYPPVWALEPRGALVALHLGVFVTALAYLLFSAGLSRVSVSAGATLTLGEPLTAALLGVFVVGERLGPLNWCGVALLFAGLGVLTIELPRRESASKRNNEDS